MELIKDIPGYKVILKAVLKGQIQYLVSYRKDPKFSDAKNFAVIHL